MPKKTYLVDEYALWELFRALVDAFGFPSYQEELVLYLAREKQLKLSLTRERFSVHWSSSNRQSDRYHRTEHAFRIGRSDLKEKMIFLAENFGSRATLSTTPLYRFDAGNRVSVEVRPRSLVGPLATILLPPDYFEQEHNRLEYQGIKGVIQRFLKPGLVENVAAVRGNEVDFVNFDIGASPILHTAILDFCHRNGILNPFKQEMTYRKILSSRNNNYSTLESVFREMTGHELLSMAAPTEWPSHMKVPVSIIIPCFNTAQSLNPILLSIAHQKIPQDRLRELEVVLIDDGSDQPVFEVAKPSDFPFRLKILRTNENAGVAHARLLGADYASGEILLFLDSDLILSEYYVLDHVLRNAVLGDAVFVSFKENVEQSDDRVGLQSIKAGLPRPKSSQDLRITKTIKRGAIGSYPVPKTIQVNILEETNYFKDFHGSRVFGIYDLSCMVTGHNFSTRRATLERTKPFSPLFKGWGMEDVFFGLRMIADGNYIVPVLSSGVYHINHPPRSGSQEEKERQYRQNVKLIDDILDAVVP